MRVAFTLARMFWQRGGARQRAGSALTAAGVTVSTVLGLLALSVIPALGARTDRVAWRTPGMEASPDDARALLLHRTDSFEGRAIERVDLGPTGTGTPPAPPGLPRFPAPGEVYLSPALAELVATHPADVLADRFGGPATGTIGPEGLAHENELAVVVGHPPETLLPGPHGPAKYRAVGVADFDGGTTDANLTLYATLARIAAVLLAVPTLLLIGAAARLTAAQRAERLAALRLGGAAPDTVVALTAFEALAAGFVGAVTGMAAYLAVLPLAARVPLAGASFPVADLRLGPAVLAAVLVLVPLGTAGSAVVGLRQVVISPLGVSRRTRPQRPGPIRLVAVPASLALLVSGTRTLSGGGSNAVALLGVAALIAAVATVGPFLTWAVGALLGATSHRASTLLAGRRITDDPKGAYRTVSAMALAGVVAGFLLAVLPAARGDANALAPADDVQVVVLAQQAPAVEAAIRETDPDATIHVNVQPMGTDEEPRVHIHVTASSPEAVERVKTATVRTVVGAVTRSSDHDKEAARMVIDDMGRASRVMALASLAMATAATGIAGAGALLDQRTTLARLRLIGTPLEVLQRARRWQAVVPLAVVSAGSMSGGALAGALLGDALRESGMPFEPSAIGWMAALVGAAALAGIAVVALTRPLLVTVSQVKAADPGR